VILFNHNDGIMRQSYCLAYPTTSSNSYASLPCLCEMCKCSEGGHIFQIAALLIYLHKNCHAGMTYQLYNSGICYQTSISLMSSSHHYALTCQSYILGNCYINFSTSLILGDFVISANSTILYKGRYFLWLLILLINLGKQHDPVISYQFLNSATHDQETLFYTLDNLWHLLYQLLKHHSFWGTLWFLQTLLSFIRVDTSCEFSSLW